MQLTHDQVRALVTVTPKQAAEIFRYAKTHQLKIEVVSEFDRTVFIIEDMPVGCGYGQIKITTSSHRKHAFARSLAGYRWFGPASLGSKSHVSYADNSPDNVHKITLYRNQKLMSTKVRCVFWIRKGDS